MKWIFTSFLALIAFAVAADESPTFYKVDSNYYGDGKPNPNPSREKLGGYPIDQKKEIGDKETAEKLIKILTDEASFKRNASVMCFQPGMGVSFIRDKKVYQFVICLHCHNMDVYIDEKLTEHELTLTDDAVEKLKAIYDKLAKPG